MGLNPETNKFEPLTEGKPTINELEKAMRSGRMPDLSPTGLVLLRPDGSPVPKSWTIFKVGELVVIKDYTFRVAYIGESNILFEPVKATDPITIPEAKDGK